MLFSSPEFLFLYLPLTLTVYFLSPLRWRNAALLVFSLLFYGWGEPIYVFLMIFTVFVDYLFGLWVEGAKSIRRKKYALWAAVTVNLVILGFFKYYDFLAVSLSRIPFISGFEPLGLELPIGISFYTFQALSYVIDVYRGEVAAQKDPISFGTYVTLFPQLIAGPIVRYREVNEQLSVREHSLSRAASGVRTFICGLCKKVLIANTAGALWEVAAAAPSSERTVLSAWMGIFWYTAQIYFDFSGYSDMAVGLGRIIGFDFPKNFNYPYVSRSITEFWRRWHISLSSWFREYVYIPLGGNRKGRGRTYLNLLTVWLLTGLWHGAGVNFVLWGLYYFVILSLEKTFLLGKLDRIPKVFGTLYTMFFVMIGWLIFVSSDGSWGFSYFLTMFGAAPFMKNADLYDLISNGVFAVIAIVGATPLPKRIFVSLSKRLRAMPYVTAVGTVSLLLLSAAFMAGASYDPFLYWNF